MESSIASVHESVRRIIDTPRPQGLRTLDGAAIGVFEPDPSDGGHIVMSASRDKARTTSEVTVAEVSPDGEIRGHRRDTFGTEGFKSVISGANPTRSLAEAGTDALLLRLSMAGELHDPTQTRYQRRRFLETMQRHGTIFPQAVQDAAVLLSPKARFKKHIKHIKSKPGRIWRRVRHSI